jgi:hypothetical protein
MITPSSSVGSDIFALVALLTISLSVLLLLRHYLPLRTTSAYLLIPVFLALAIPCSIILLVPIDLASSSGTEDEAAKGIWLPAAVMLVVWRIAYWLTFCLTWWVFLIREMLHVLGLTPVGLSYHYLANLSTRDIALPRIE